MGPSFLSLRSEVRLALCAEVAEATRSTLSRQTYQSPSMLRRLDKRRIATALSRYLVNPPVRALFRLGSRAPGTAILETIGRRSGKRRRTPVTDGLDGSVFWIVAEHGHRAAFVRNIESHPQVRVKVGRRWRSGSAQPLDDDPRARLRQVARTRRRSTVNAWVVRAMGTDLVTLRVDLDTG